MSQFIVISNCINYTTWKVDRATPMYWFIMARYQAAFGSDASPPSWNHHHKHILIDKRTFRPLHFEKCGDSANVTHLHDLPLGHFPEVS